MTEPKKLYFDIPLSEEMKKQMVGHKSMNRAVNFLTFKLQEACEALDTLREEIEKLKNEQ